MPLHTGFHPTCAVAFCPIYDTARQNFASKVRRLSWENHLFRFTYCAMERRLKNCGSHCWHNFRFQRLLGMVCTMESKEMILPRWPHNLLPQISPPNHLDKIPSPYYHKDTFSKRYRFSFHLPSSHMIYETNQYLLQNTGAILLMSCAVLGLGLYIPIHKPSSVAQPECQVRPILPESYTL